MPIDSSSAVDAWTPALSGSESDPLPSVVHQAIGTATACWENRAGAGVFDSDRARWVAEGLEAWLREQHSTTDIYELRERGVRVLDSDQCCLLACSGGACESCPCCCAGWCVWGTDGMPDRETDADNYRIWLEVASEHNTVAKRLLELESAPVFDVQTCRACGCTEDDCSGCVAGTGQPCSWAEPDLCTACVPAGVRS